MTPRSVLSWMTVGLVGLVGCQQAHAQSDSEECKGIVDPTERLACYDRLASGGIEFCGHRLDNHP